MLTIRGKDTITIHHILSLSLSDDKLQCHGTQALTNIMVTGSATLTRGRPLSHSMRKRVHTVSAVRKSLHIPPSGSRVSYIY